jgi:hypothetical protein
VFALAAGTAGAFVGDWAMTGTAPAKIKIAKNAL